MATVKTKFMKLANVLLTALLKSLFIICINKRYML